MRRRLLPLLCLPLLLAACGDGPSGTNRANIRWENLMKNPLYAQRYWEDLTDRMVELQVQDKEVQSDATMLAVVDEVRRTALERSQAEIRKKREGIFGGFVPAQEYAEGSALLRSGMLSLSPVFLTAPGPSLHIYLTTVIDPRDVTFPDATSVDVGRLESPYGAQEYALPSGTKTEGLRTVVLYDTKLKRTYGFAQLQ